MARRSGDRAIPTFVPYVGIYQERLKGTNALLFVNPESMAIGGKPWKGSSKMSAGCVVVRLRWRR